MNFSLSLMTHLTGWKSVARMSAATSGPYSPHACSLSPGRASPQHPLLVFQNQTPDDFEKHPVAASAEIVAWRLHIPRIFEVRVRMAAVQQLIQECQHY